MASTEPDKQETLVQVEVPTGYAGNERLDLYLTNKLPNVSRAKVQAGIRDGVVSVNGTPVRKSSYKVQAGDVLDCILMKPPPIVAEPEDIPLDIVFEDNDLLIVNKPAGMVVHPAYGNRTGTLVNALLFYLGGGTITLDERDEEPAVPLSTNHLSDNTGTSRLRPGIVHRLDKDTSGLLVVAKTDEAHTGLAHQFMNRTIYRRYISILWGVPAENEGTITAYLGRDRKDRKRVAVVGENHGKLAITHFKVLEEYTFTSLVEFRLETGRTHQIRVHAMHMNHPVFGDLTYGGTSLRYGPQTKNRKAFMANLFSQLPRQALHARSLGFEHPLTGETLRFESELPEDFVVVREKLKDIDQNRWAYRE